MEATQTEPTCEPLSRTASPLGWAGVPFLELMADAVGDCHARPWIQLWERMRAWSLPVAITVDLHGGDSPDDIKYAAEYLRCRMMRGTFFVPSSMLLEAKYKSCLRQVPGLGHEVASHAHKHDSNEISALIDGRGAELAFLRRSKSICEDVMGQPPESFRSPAWCKLGRAAVDELQDLEYHVDSSATPGRWALLTSFPRQPTWSHSPRSPWFLRPGLLEIPTSTFLVPAGSPTFSTLRRTLAVLFVRLLATESYWHGNHVLVLQFHPDDFNPRSQDRPRRRLQLSDFLLNDSGGFRFKYSLRTRCSSEIATITHTILDAVSVAECCCYSLAELATVLRARQVTNRDQSPEGFGAI